jgi:hypothetical protein
MVHRFPVQEYKGFWILDLGIWNLDLCRPVALRLVAPLKIRTWNFDLGIWNLEFGTWVFIALSPLSLSPLLKLGLGTSTLELRPWNLDLGIWNLGLCRLVSPLPVAPLKIVTGIFGIWDLEFGPWNLGLGSLTSSYIHHPNIYFPPL